jgi:hypothetical protein
MTLPLPTLRLPVIASLRIFDFYSLTAPPRRKAFGNSGGQRIAADYKLRDGKLRANRVVPHGYAAAMLSWR